MPRGEEALSCCRWYCCITKQPGTQGLQMPVAILMGPYIRNSDRHRGLAQLCSTITGALAGRLEGWGWGHLKVHSFPFLVCSWDEWKTRSADQST